jgi:hypothetical protein
MANTYQKVSLAKWRDLAMKVYGRLRVTKHELFAIREETGWVIPSVIWKNVQTDKTLVIPQDGENPVQVDFTRYVPQEKPRIPVDQLFEDLEDLVNLVVDRHRPSLLITGSPGVGKTHTVMDVLAAAGLQRGEDWVLVKGKTSPYGVYRTLFTHRNKIIVYDDSDAVFASQDARNLLKGALDSYGRRTISWQSNITCFVGGSDEEKEDRYAEIDEAMMAGDDQVKLPSEFDFKGRVIFVSNLHVSKIEAAVVSRSLTIDVTLTSDEVLDRLTKISGPMQPASGKLSDADKNEILTHMRDLANENPTRAVTVRDFVGAMQIRVSGNPRWKKLLRYSMGA